ncbi:hypothetical protein AAE478_007155 [Parahypoxylon ruwenzoriense]
MILSRSPPAVPAAHGIDTLLDARPLPSKAHPIPAPRRPTVDNGKGKGKEKAQPGPAVERPWADGPWPLIETPSRRQHITQPAQHIANELAHAHNAMLRGLNAIFLQAPYIPLPRPHPHPQDDHDDDDDADAAAADFSFLAHTWASWVLAHHTLKETAVIPALDAALGLPPGSLGLSARATAAAAAAAAAADSNGDSERARNDNNNNNNNNKEEEEEEEEEKEGPLEARLRRIIAYTTSTHAQPTTYSPSALQRLLVSLAEVLVPHLHAQIPLLLRMHDFCSTPTFSSSPTSSPSPPSPSPSSSPSPPHSKQPPPKPDDPSIALTHILRSLTAPPQAAPASASTVLPLLAHLRDATRDDDGGGGGVNAWPHMSVPALHAVAERLSPPHAGAWRFLPCDVWGRPRDLPYAFGDGGRAGEEGVMRV